MDALCNLGSTLNPFWNRGYLVSSGVAGLALEATPGVREHGAGGARSCERGLAVSSHGLVHQGLAVYRKHPSFSEAGLVNQREHSNSAY